MTWAGRGDCDRHFLVSSILAAAELEDSKSPMSWSLNSLLPDLNRRLSQVTELPPLPEVAHGLLKLKQDPGADARKLAALIELDPSMASQIMKYAGSAFFGYRGKIESIQDAVGRVLGFEKAMHIALGLAAGKALSHSQEGPLGLRAFWTHAFKSAHLMQALARSTSAHPRPSLGLLYLAGLVHDIGFLLLGYLLEPEFNILNRAVEENPDAPITQLEVETLGLTHAELGVGLLRQWKMPQEVLAVVLNHHNVYYQGEWANYVRMAILADTLLKKEHGGDGELDALPANILVALGLTDDDANEALASLNEQQEGIDGLVAQIVQSER